MRNSITSEHIELWREETKRQLYDKAAFLSWFNTSESIEDSYASGYLDFSYHILKPKVCQLLGRPFERTALEIGYGAGRLLVPASGYFRLLLGVDIHEPDLKAEVDREIAGRGGKNIRTFSSDGKSLPFVSESVDFVYSYIVLQHLARADMLVSYVSECHRVLRGGGCAILYMGYLPGCLRRRYSDLTTDTVDTARKVTLRVTMPFARHTVKHCGFELHEMMRSHKYPWSKEYGGQFYVIVRKP